MMDVTVGTFNLNNLFSRYNFEAEIKKVLASEGNLGSEVKYEFREGSTYRIREYLGRLVAPKEDKETNEIAERIKRMGVDVLAIQEVEDIDMLRRFNKDNLGGMYPYEVLVEGNDRRLIDVGILSRLPVGGITSWQCAVHPEEPNRPVFSRDLLQVEILNRSRSEKLFTVFNNHLKSPFITKKDDAASEQKKNDERRTRQAEVVARIVKAQTRPSSSFIILGDMNDAPDSVCLRAFTADEELKLTNALSRPQETRPAPPDTPPPDSSAWTHRFRPSKKPAQYELFDQIWLSSALADRQTGAWIDRRTKLGGNGSDHDPSWIRLSL